MNKDVLEKHKLWLDNKENGVRANLRRVDLEDVDLRDADLEGAKLDYSCFPLWCGGIGWKVDDKLPRMLAAFICTMKCDDDETKEMQKMLLPYAKKNHRAEDILGEIER